MISNGTHPFEILTDEQALALAYQDIGGITYPLNSINAIFQNDVPMVVGTDNTYKTNYLDLLPIRNLYLISNTLGNHNSMSINGEWGILNKIPVSSGYNKLIYDQTVIGMDYLDCLGQTLSRIDFKVKDHEGNIVNLHGNHISFSIIFVKVTDE